jgi:RimJ/RimL family protein N-acetyltransferase
MIATLRTKRLALRPICADDISAFVPLLDDFDVVKNLTHVPHPYTVADGRAFIARTEQKRREGLSLNYAVLLGGETFVGFCTANIEDENGERHPGSRELGYWYGKPFWGRGYATEAAQAVVEYAFDQLGTAALTSGVYVDNPASLRVLKKLGFRETGMAERNCVSRGSIVIAHEVLLTREAFAGRARA